MNVAPFSYPLIYCTIRQEGKHLASQLQNWSWQRKGVLKRHKNWHGRRLGAEELLFVAPPTHMLQALPSKPILGSFAKSWKATVSFVTSVRLHKTRLPLKGFSWNLICEAFFENVSRKFQFSLKSDKNNRYFTVRPIYVHFVSYLAQFFVEWEIFQTEVVEKIKTHILISITAVEPIGETKT